MFAPVQLEGAATRRAAKVQEVKDLAEVGRLPYMILYDPPSAILAILHGT